MGVCAEFLLSGSFVFHGLEAAAQHHDLLVEEVDQCNTFSGIIEAALLAGQYGNAGLRIIFLDLDRGLIQHCFGAVRDFIGRHACNMRTDVFGPFKYRCGSIAVVGILSF